MIRTPDARFRKPTLYPLSYGSGDCAKGGAKPLTGASPFVRGHLRARCSADSEAAELVTEREAASCPRSAPELLQAALLRGACRRCRASASEFTLRA